jgi:hypothetical protein
VQDLASTELAILGSAEVRFNRAGIGFGAHSQGVPAGTGIGVGLDIQVPDQNERVLEGFLLLAPASFTHNENVTALGLEACLFLDGFEESCEPVVGFESRFLQIPARDLDGDGQLEVRLVAVARRSIDAPAVPTHTVAILEHLRVR